MWQQFKCCLPKQLRQRLMLPLMRDLISFYLASGFMGCVVVFIGRSSRPIHGCDQRFSPSSDGLDIHWNSVDRVLMEIKVIESLNNVFFSF